MYGMSRRRGTVGSWSGALHRAKGYGQQWQVPGVSLGASVACVLSRRPVHEKFQEHQV